MGAIRGWLARHFGAAPDAPQPTDPVVVREHLGDVEAGLMRARLGQVGIHSWWPPGDRHRSRGAIVGPLLVRREDEARALAVLDAHVGLDPDDGLPEMGAHRS